MSQPAAILWGKLTPLSLGALGLALALGALGAASGSPWIAGTADLLQPLGSLWISALRMTIIPLVVTQLLSATAGYGGEESIGGIGGRTVGLFVGYLIATGIASVTVMPFIVELFTVDPAIAASLRAETTIPQAALDVAAGAPVSLGEWVTGLVPVNVFAAAVEGSILPLLVFTALFGLAVARLPGPQRDELSALFRALAEAIMRMVTWVLWATPVAVFALVLGLTLQLGAEAFGLVGFYVLIVCAWMLAVTGALYPVSSLLGRTSLLTFGRAVAPAQMVGLSTRSSLASLPALVEGGQEHLRLSPAGTGFVLPLSASAFKMSTMTAEPVRYLFLAHLFGVPLTLAGTATFLATLVLLSFSGVGVPRGGSGFDTLPAFLAAGIPIEGLVLVVAVDTIPDLAKTLINVTGHMSIAAVATRGERSA